MRTELARIALTEINDQTTGHFEDITTEIDLFDTAVAEYDGIILQLLFPNPAAGYPKFQLLKTDIASIETTVYFKNEDGETDLTFQQVVLLVNDYITGAEEAFERKYPPGK